MGRERAGITQSEMAGRCGLSLVTICRCEKGLTEPKMENMVKMCHVLNIPLEDVAESYKEELYKIGDRLKVGGLEKD